MSYYPHYAAPIVPTVPLSPYVSPYSVAPLPYVPAVSSVDVAVAQANANLAYASAISPRAYVPPYTSAATEIAIANAHTDAAISASVRRARLASPYYY